MGAQHRKKQYRNTFVKVLTAFATIGLLVLLGLLAPVASAASTGAPVPVTGGTEVPEIQYGKTNTGSVNVRAEPSTKSAKVATLRKGVAFPIVDSETVGQHTWYQVELDDVTAYIRGDLVELIEEADALALLEAQAAKTVRASSGGSGGNSPSGASSGRMVWLSATGSKYHSRNNCGNMNPDKARQVTLEEAVNRGMGKCKKCH